MLIGSLLLGLLAGSYLPINLGIVIAAGMIASIAMPMLPPALCLFSLGVGVAVTAKNVIQSAFAAKIVVNKEDTTEEKEAKAEVAARSARHEFDMFSSTMAFAALPMYLLNLINGLSQFLLPVSIIAIFVQSWTTVTSNPKKAVGYGIIAIIIMISAFLTINTGSASSVFLYFLTLVSIPSALKKQESNVESNDAPSHSTTPIQAFLYGQGSNGSIITAMVLLQTILWGSGKDTLGTIVNGTTSMMLDPVRVATCVIIIAFMLWFNMFRKEAVINDCVKEFVNNKKRNRLLEIAINAVSLVFALTTVNPVLAIGLLTAGLIINAFVDTSIVRSFSVPALLISGVFIA